MNENTFENADPANEIVPRMWLGSFKAASNENWLKSHNIQIIFNCTKDLPFINCSTVEKRIRIPIHDNLQPEEIQFLTEHASSTAFELMKLWQSGKIILVHCAAGMQRSAASVAFFLITLFKFHTNDAIYFIKERRPIAFTPSPNFLQSIQYYDNFFHSYILPTL